MRRTSGSRWPTRSARPCATAWTGTWWTPARPPPPAGARGLADARGLVSIPGLNCLDDFTVYMVNDATRADVIARFTGVVKPLLAQGAGLDIIAHSWGTVVAYEGLRELEDAGLTEPGVHTFFTAGAALSLAPVRAPAAAAEPRRPPPGAGPSLGQS